MRNYLIMLLYVLSYNLFGQQIFSTCICEQLTNKPITYATALNISCNKGSISNTDGSCKIPFFRNNDSLVISHVGYRALRVTVIEITDNDTIFLIPDMIMLSPVTIVSTWNQETLVNQLHEVLSYNRSKNYIYESKSNVLLTSYIDSIPLERIESIGNLYIKNGGVNEYVHRMGRFGQNTENNFFTLSIESILNNFKLFDTPKEKIPLLITQLNKKQINSLFNLSRYDHDHENAGILKDKMKDVHNLYFGSELYKLDIGYFIYPVENNDDSLSFKVITCINTSGSYYFLPKNLFGEIAINLYLDTFKKNRKKLESILAKTHNAEDAISHINQAFSQSREEADDHLRKCERGSELSQLLLWNEIIDSSLNTDRISTMLNDLVSGISDSDYSKVDLFEQCATIGLVYFETRQCKKAKICFERSLAFKEEVSQKSLGKLYYDLGLTCACLGELEQACLNYKDAQFYGHKVPSKLMNKVCE